MPRCTARAILALTVALATTPFGHANDEERGTFDALEWRCLGPHRGGRVIAVAGVRGERGTYYMGAAGGGVWRTENAGTTWTNLTDGHLGCGTIGSIAVAPSDDNVIYVGTGEGPIRGVTTASGDGLYRSTDRGRTWTKIGLEDAHQIPAVRVHPDDPDTAWVAAQGSPWGPTGQRGVFKTTDGGASWTRVLYVDDTTGACDLALDPTNPRILYAAMWDHHREPWQIRSGGPGSGIHKSTDGGETWTRLEGGLPDVMGKIGVAVSPADPDRVWALVEADEGGLYRSDDGGASWSRTYAHRSIIARSWYYMHVYADPVDRDTVFVLNSPMLKSIDSGNTFSRIRAPHVDHHALWIDPDDPQVMVNGNDGGANVTFDGGATWSTQSNQPTAQFYRVICDDAQPYRVYGGQQDNSTVCIASRNREGGIGMGDWESVGGGESAHLAFDPARPRYVYGTSILGWITEFDRRTRLTRSVQAYPQFGLGTDARDYRYRFNWNAPVLVSMHDPSVIYHAAHVMLRSDDRGNTWTEISPDLTRNDDAKHGRGGVPFTNEAASAEVYNTIFYVAESPHDSGVMWTGSDCGLVHVTRDGAKTWNDVTPNRIGEAQINMIEASPHAAGTAYLAITKYKLDDDRPIIRRTTNFGRSWETIETGLPDGAFVRVIREDPVRPGLLYIGTETGVHVSFDDGASWSSLQTNLPVVPITDMRIHRDDIVVATQGRAFWILDDVSPLRAWADIHDQSVALVQSKDVLRIGRADGFGSKPGTNPPDGAIIDFVIADPPEADGSVRLEILDDADNVIRTFTNAAHPDADCYLTTLEPHAEAGEPYGQLSVEPGLNRFVWNLRRENVPCIEGHVIPSGWAGPRVHAAEYKVRLTANGQIHTRPLRVQPDPRSTATADDRAAYARVMRDTYELVSEAHRAVATMRSIGAQADDRRGLAADLDAGDRVLEAADRLAAALDAWDDEVVQSQRQTQQDVANFPSRLSMEMLYLMGNVDGSDAPVTAGSEQRLADLEKAWRGVERRMNRIIDGEVRELNETLASAGLPLVHVP